MTVTERRRALVQFVCVFVIVWVAADATLLAQPPVRAVSTVAGWIHLIIRYGIIAAWGWIALGHVAGRSHNQDGTNSLWDRVFWTGIGFGANEVAALIT